MTDIDLSSGFSGKIIVAMPHLADTPFEQAVCLICTHDDDHAFGVIFNKPMKGAKLADVLQEVGITSSETAGRAPIFFGGPVGVERGAVIHSLDKRWDETLAITPEIGLTATRAALEAIATGIDAPRHASLIMGHSGWSGGQLENEIKRNDWLSIDTKPELIFGDHADAWTSSLNHLGISDLTMFSGNEQPVPRPN
ncbi:MAG: YqgE/AlgH family protein [Pseudomonadota bacterium]